MPADNGGGPAGPIAEKLGRGDYAGAIGNALPLAAQAVSGASTMHPEMGEAVSGAYPELSGRPGMAEMKAAGVQLTAAPAAVGAGHPWLGYGLLARGLQNGLKGLKGLAGSRGFADWNAVAREWGAEDYNSLPENLKISAQREAAERSRNSSALR
jgi:hypothetical protein